MNVGGRRVTNDTLIACFEELGFGSVSAFLASGNVMFDAGERLEPVLKQMVEAQLFDDLGYPVQAFVRSGAAVAGIAVTEPFSSAETAASRGKLQVALLSDTPGAASKREALRVAPAEDLLAFEHREMYWLPAGNMSDSELNMAALAKILGPTVRTQRTMQRLVPKLN
jgi:uncharacterized protein (DUF1697 family)